MKHRILAPLFGLALLASSPGATLIDDFSGSFPATTVVILDANGGASNTASFSTAGGTLSYVTTSYDGIEQTASYYSGFSLGIGEELQITIAHTGASQDLGIFVGAVPTSGTRANYVNVYGRNSTTVYSRGFNGTSELGLTGGATTGAYNRLFILRDGTSDYELGYYLTDGTRVVVADRNGLNAAVDGTALGIYTDVRAAGTLGAVDNLLIVPEPAAALLGAFGLLGLLRRRRA